MNKQIENILIVKQVAPTPTRVMVLEFILKQTTAIGFSDLEKAFQQTDRTTLYRTLKTFEEQGLIHNIKGSSDAAKYALCEAECRPGVHHDMHIHFYCINCKELSCLPKEDLPEIKLPGNYQLQEISFVARGICDKCSNGAT